MRKIIAKLHAVPEGHGSAVDQARSKVQSAVADVPGLVHLTEHERLHATKVHTGAERYIGRMAALAEEHPALCPKDVEPRSILARLARAEDLASLRATLAGALQAVDDTILAASGSAYHDALDIYAMAASAARRDPDVHAAIAPFEAFLAVGPRAPKADAAK